uniref:RING-type E3 ubiquitin transferase n=1 Tax=Gopherus evgoodei TaxID=1825980 RepID=A0A8C4Y8J2_9SAUR
AQSDGENAPTRPEEQQSDPLPTLPQRWGQFTLEVGVRSGARALEEARGHHVALPCLHPVCCQCLEAQRLPAAAFPAPELRCPICEQKATLSEPWGMDELPSSSFLLGNLQDVVGAAAEEQHHSGRGPTPPPRQQQQQHRWSSSGLSPVLHFFCDTCSVPICWECTTGPHVGHNFLYLQGALQDSGTLTIQLLGDAQQGLQAIQVEKINQVKAKSLYLQVEKLRQNLNELGNTISAVQQVLEEGCSTDILLARDCMLAQVQDLKNVRGLQPQEDDTVTFTPPDQALYTAIKSMGFVGSGAFASLTRATGEGLKCALQGRVASFTVTCYDHDGNPCLSGGDTISAVVMGPDGNQFDTDVHDQQNGTYLVSYRPQLEGEHLVSVLRCNHHIENSPFKVMGFHLSVRKTKEAPPSRPSSSKFDLLPTWGIMHKRVAVHIRWLHDEGFVFLIILWFCGRWVVDSRLEKPTRLSLFVGGIMSSFTVCLLDSLDLITGQTRLFDFKVFHITLGGFWCFFLFCF